MRVCQGHDFFYKVLKVAIAQEYGVDRSTEEGNKDTDKEKGTEKEKGNEREKEKQKEKHQGEEKEEKKGAEADDHHIPEPLSYCSFLEYVLKRDSWGNKTVLLLFSLIWQIRITVLHSLEQR